MRISDWSSDVCSSDLRIQRRREGLEYQLLCTAADRHVLRPASEAFFPQDSVGNRPPQGQRTRRRSIMGFARSHRSKRPINDVGRRRDIGLADREIDDLRSEEHTSELQSLMRISSAVFCLKKKDKSTCDTVVQKKTHRNK